MALPGTNLLLLAVIVTLAVLVGLIMWGVALFKDKSTSIAVLDAPKIAICCIASAVTTFLVMLGLMPSLTQWVSGLNVVMQGLVYLIASIGIPILVLAGCLSIVGSLNSQEAGALALFGQGGFSVAVTLGYLVLAADLANSVRVLPFGLVSSFADVETIKTGLWAMLFIGAALMFAGYQMGMKLTNIEEEERKRKEAEEKARLDRERQVQLDRQNNTESNKNTQLGGLQPPANSSWVVINDGRSKGKQFPLSSGDLKIGRSSSCPIRLQDDEEVSREHAMLRLNNGFYQLHDLASVNGTYLNGDRVGEARTLMDGDQVRVGKTTLVYKKVG